MAAIVGDDLIGIGAALAGGADKPVGGAARGGRASAYNAIGRAAIIAFTRVRVRDRAALAGAGGTGGWLVALSAQRQAIQVATG